jgi:hypothetical protein
VYYKNSFANNFKYILYDRLSSILIRKVVKVPLMYQKIKPKEIFFRMKEKVIGDFGLFRFVILLRGGMLLHFGLITSKFSLIIGQCRDNRDVQ